MAETVASATTTPSTFASPLYHHILRRFLILVMWKADLVAWRHWLTEAALVDGHEIYDLRLGVAHRIEHADRTGGLRHRLDDQDARHDWLLRKMTGEMRLVDRDIFDADRRIVVIDLDDAVHQQERIAMRQQRHQLADIDGLKRYRLCFSHNNLVPFF